jgi:outer membrane biogenesis lipoprotein LolB
MNKQIKWIVLAMVLLWLTGCTHTSEAKVNVFNKGDLRTYLSISYSSSQINPGQTETFTLTWPGRDEMRVNMLSFPVGQPERSQNLDLKLNDGDDITVNVEFK